VKIWNEWPHARYVKRNRREYLAGRFRCSHRQGRSLRTGLGDLGPVYGKQWVDWPTYRYRKDGLYEPGEGINQVAQVVESLRTNPAAAATSSKGWNVAQLDQMALPPCHKTYQFHVAGEPFELPALPAQLAMSPLALPFNLWSAALLARMMAQQTGYEPGELVWMGGDTHLYLNHAHLIEEQLTRQPDGNPTLEITRKARNNFRLPDRGFCGAMITRRCPRSRPLLRSDRQRLTPLASADIGQRPRCTRWESKLMADPADPTCKSPKASNRPALALHVPEPKFRPGDTADFSDIDIGNPGDQPRPDETARPEEMKDLAYGLVRVLGDDNKAHGPWDPKLDPETLRTMLGNMALVPGRLTNACFAASVRARPRST
jgi:thymidylate synthase